MEKPKLRFKREDGNEYPSLFKCSIEDVSDIKNGPFGSVLHSSDYVLEGTPIITTEHFKSGIIQSDVSTIPKVSEEDYRRLKGYVLEAGDIVFSRVGSIDINALVTERENGWLFSGRVIRVRLKSNYHSGYIHYLLSTQRVKNDIVARAVGQTMPSINSEILNATSLMITTSYEEQQKIADFLSTVDEIISLSEAEVQNFEQQKKAAMQKIFSQEVRFRREDGTEFPEWEELTMDNIFAEIIEKDRTDLPVLSILQGQGTVYRDSFDRNIMYDKKSTVNYKAMKKGDFIIHLRTFEGGLECATLDGISSPAYKILRTNKLIPDAYKGYFRSKQFIDGKLAVAVTGVRDGKNIEMNTFWQILIPVPCLEEQQKIAMSLT